MRAPELLRCTRLAAEQKHPTILVQAIAEQFQRTGTADFRDRIEISVMGGGRTCLQFREGPFQSRRL